MPTFRRIESRLTPSGSVSAGPRVQALDFAPVAQGLQRVADDQERAALIAERERKDQAEKQAALLERQQVDEARVAVGNAVSARRAAVTEQLIASESSAEGMAGATERVLKDHEAWFKTTETGLSEPGKKLLALQADDIRLMTHERFLGAETKARQVGLVRDYGTGLDADRRTVAADPSQLTDVLARRLATVKTLSVPETTRATLAEQTRETLALDAAMTVADRNPDEILQRSGMAGKKTGKDGKPLPADPAKAAEAVASDPILSNLSPDRLRGVIDRATTNKVQREALAAAEQERMARQAEIATNRREREAAQAYTIASTVLRDGRTLDMTNPANAQMVKAMTGTPYEAAYRSMLAEVPKRTAAAMQPLSVQRGQLDYLIEQRNTAGTSKDLDDEIKRREQVLAAAEKDYAADPLRAGAERGIAKLAPVDTSTFDGIVQGIGANMGAALTVQQQTGRAVVPLTTEQVDALGRQIAALPDDQRSAKMVMLARSLQPQQAQALAQQMDKSDRAMALELATAATFTSEGRYVSELVRKGSRALKDRVVKEDRMAATGWEAAINRGLEGVYSDPRQQQMAADAAKFILAGKMAEGSSSGGVRDVQEALRLAVGGAVVEHNSGKIPLPADMKLDQLETGIKALTPAAFADQAPDGNVYVSRRPMPLAQFVASLPAATLRYAGPGRYYVATAPKGGTLVSNKDGSPIIVRAPNAR